MKIGILVTTGPERQDLYTALRLAQAARAQGHAVKLFVMGDGVFHLADHPKNPWGEELRGLLAAGAEVACCSTNCEPRGLRRDGLLPGVLWGSQYDHAAIVHWSDRYLVFG